MPCAQHPRKAARFGRRAMTLIEVLIAAILCGMVLFVLMLGMDGIRSELKRRHTLGLLGTLDRALMAYHRATGIWPVDPGLPVPAKARTHAASPIADDIETGHRMVMVLAGEPASRSVLETIPPVLRVEAGPADRGDTTGGNSFRAPPTPSPGSDWGRVQDSWGRPLRCLTSASPSSGDRKAVAANENRPIFISAGPNGDFGIDDPAAKADNLRSDELGGESEYADQSSPLYRVAWASVTGGMGK